MTMPASQCSIPAGRGVYAHPMLALSSDQTSPVVLQADSGPIAGDRMIGSFARENDRLVIHVNSIIHQGETIGADGVVIAPDTMEASVATEVDQHYLARFILPAAAAFVQGLGQALATTSNTTAVLSPLGGATTTTHLNFHQQLGVAAGVAAAQIGIHAQPGGAERSDRLAGSQCRRRRDVPLARYVASRRLIVAARKNTSLRSQFVGRCCGIARICMRLPWTRTSPRRRCRKKQGPR